ncbi:MAG TPA: EAL domain-containing protein [Steroidobacteraceae bacterium]|nr:EAL domain-containing protein [Steroidobacteraceae bacterium]
MKSALQLVVVEDSPTDAELLARNLNKAGLDVVIHRVDTEPDFVAALSSVQPDLILSDFSLPQFNGLRALEVAVEHAPETPFIFVSGTIGEERAIDALRRGATDYVLKTNLSRLPAAVERALREVALKAARAKSEQQRRDQEVRLRRLTRTYRMLSSTSSAILRLRNRMELFDEVCRIAVHQGGYDRVTISLIDQDARTLRPRARAGRDSAELRALECVNLESAELESRPEPPYMAERAIRSGVPSVHNDLGGEPGSGARHEALAAHGYRAIAALPVRIDGTAVGVISLFSDQRGVFDEAELDVLLELTANLGFALQYLEKDEAVHFLSYFDSLTGLAKRPLFCQRLAQLMSFDAAGDGTLTVVVFDVQKLGAINDSLGRYIGDRLLERIAARLKETYKDSECAAYFGGGTFALMLPSAAAAADTGRILQSAAAQVFVEPFDIDGQELRPAIRSGVAFYPHDADSADSLVQNAEAALKAAREDNEKYMLYGLVTTRPTSRSLALEARLAGALDRDEFRLHYQPKVDIASGGIQGFEALLRWQDTQDGLVPPSIFVPLLERSGAIVDVGEWVLQQAVRDIHAFVAAGLNSVRVAVNVSPLQLRRRDFVERVLASVEPATAQACGVDIEITESMLMQDLELSIRKLALLREAGVGIAIDDFGTGYSSLRLLAKLPVDTLKIDRSFVQSIADTPNVLTLVSTIVSLARAFGMKTVAEGVETTEQMSLLRSMNCDQAQGYLLGRPTPASDVAAVVARLQPGARL